MPHLRERRMTGLALVLTGEEGSRLDAAVDIAATLAAMGQPVSVLLKADAVTRPPLSALATLTALGASISACPTALADRDQPLHSLPDGVQSEGLVSFLSRCHGWQLLLA